MASSKYKQKVLCRVHQVRIYGWLRRLQGAHPQVYVNSKGPFRYYCVQCLRQDPWRPRDQYSALRIPVESTQVLPVTVPVLRGKPEHWQYEPEKSCMTCLLTSPVDPVWEHLNDTN